MIDKVKKAKKLLMIWNELCVSLRFSWAGSLIWLTLSLSALTHLVSFELERALFRKVWAWVNFCRSFVSTCGLQSFYFARIFVYVRDRRLKLCDRAFIFFLIINIYFPGNINVYLPRLSASGVEVVAMMTRKVTNLFILSKLWCRSSCCAWSSAKSRSPSSYI